MAKRINPVRNTNLNPVRYTLLKNNKAKLSNGANKKNKISNRVKIKIGSVETEAELNNSKTARLIWDALPISASCNRWGDEIYFYVSVKTGLEDPKELVKLGDLGYWPEGPALCIFFGPTLISKGKEIRPASAVNIIGKLAGNPNPVRNTKFQTGKNKISNGAKEFKKVSEGETIVLEKL
jgi:hypothetical protein